MNKTKIQWTDKTWNPVTGCTQISPGCDNCYALQLAERFRGSPAFPQGFDLQLRPKKLDAPIRLKVASKIFVNSMSDLFHRDVPDEYISRVWDTMMQADHHIYQVLTKRTHRMAHKIKSLGLPTPEHIWLGTSVENQELATSRLPALISIPAPVRFVSAEPLLGPVSLVEWLDDLQWVIVGGESGPNRRPMNYDWARSLRDQCAMRHVPFFYKQGNASRPGQDEALDGQVYHEFPAHALEAA